jgi:hypothetical protein
MSTGTTIAVVAGVGAVGVGGLLLYRHLHAAVPAAAPAVAQVVAAAAPASPTSAAARIVNTIQSVNTTGCTAIASKTGVPGALAQAGCSSYFKFLSPIGATETVIKAAEKIPVVGKAVSATVNAVTQVVSKPISAVKSLFSSIF